jgi:hypothetical protein
MIAHRLVAEVTSFLWLSNNGNFSVGDGVDASLLSQEERAGHLTMRDSQPSRNGSFDTEAELSEMKV